MMDARGFKYHLLRDERLSDISNTWLSKHKMKQVEIRVDVSMAPPLSRTRMIRG